MSKGMKMVDVTEGQVDPTPKASSNGVVEEPKDKVAYESFRKSVESEKRARERVRELEAALEEKNNAELESQGKHQDLIVNLKSRLQETEGELKRERENYLWNNVTSAVKTEALKKGCKNPDKLVRLLDKDDFSMLQSENGRIIQDSLAALVDKAQKENDFLFTKTAIRVNDATPSSKISSAKPLAKMSAEERLNEMKKSIGNIFNK